MSAIIFILHGILVVVPLSISIDRCSEAAKNLSNQYNEEVVCIETTANPYIQKIYPELKK